MILPVVPSKFPEPRDDAPLVVFDFDHTLYDGDSGSHLFKWLIDRAWWRQLLALLAAPVAGPMVATILALRLRLTVYCCPCVVFSPESETVQSVSSAVSTSKKPVFW